MDEPNETHNTRNKKKNAILGKLGRELKLVQKIILRATEILKTRFNCDKNK